MALERSQTDPALWQDPGAGAGPGTYAVVIGVSRYDHLPAPGAPPPDPPPPYNGFGLGQLNVSALTAYRFFTWLRDQYRYETAPLARCWMVLSPTQAEAAQEPELATYPRATMSECKRVVQEWAVAMGKLHPEYLEASRAMFFFSGHGIHSGNRQLLLPADWLRPPLPNPDEALSAQNLMSGLRSIPLPEEFLFLDACRSQPPDMATLQLAGERVLPELPQTRVDPSRVSPLMWASAAGTEAWQPDSPTQGLSLFGTALLEGLGGRVPGDPECVHSRGHISLYGLGQFVNKRVSQLLKQHGSTVPRPIRIGESSDVCITAPVAPAPQPAPPTGAGGGGGPGMGMGMGMAGTTGPGGSGGSGSYGAGGGSLGFGVSSPAEAGEGGGAGAGGGVGDWFPADDERAEAPAAADELEEEDAGIWLDVPPDGVRPEQVSVGDLHHVFGSEHLSDMWHRARVIPLDAADGAQPPLVVHAVKCTEDALWHVEFSVEASGPHWLELSDHTHTYAVTLPGDAYLRPRYTLDFSKDVDGTFHRAEAGLAPDSPGMLGEMARLWQKYSDLRLREVIGELDARVFEEALRSKMQSPLAAEIAGLFLLRGRKYDRLHDWLGNLARWHPQRTDGPVLWAEHLRQARVSEQIPADQVEQMLEVARRGLPRTSEAMEYLGGQLEEVLRFAFFPRVRHTADEQQQLIVLMRLRERVTRALAHLRTGGLFAVYAGARDSLSPELVRPA